MNGEGESKRLPRPGVPARLGGPGNPPRRGGGGPESGSGEDRGGGATASRGEGTEGKGRAEMSLPNLFTAQTCPFDPVSPRGKRWFRAPGDEGAPRAGTPRHQLRDTGGTTRENQT